MLSKHAFIHWGSLSIPFGEGGGGVLKTVLVWGAFIIIISKAFQFGVETA